MTRQSTFHPISERAPAFWIQNLEAFADRRSIDADPLQHFLKALHMVKILFFIGSFEAAKVWVNEIDVAVTVEFLIRKYRPLREKQNYAITLERDSRNVPEIEGAA